MTNSVAGILTGWVGASARFVLQQSRFLAAAPPILPHIVRSCLPEVPKNQMNLKSLLCCFFRFRPTSSSNMAKDKDDPDLSPTALADNSGGHQEVTSPPFFNTSSNEKHYKVTDDPVNASKSMTGDHDQQNVASPSSSDANTPNTFSTDEQPKTQPQSDDEILGHAEPANDMSSPDQEETRWALITDPDSGPSHPDLDLTNVDHLTRIIALLQNGWTFSHGRGPRDHQHCLYCRGPIESDIDIFTHVGKTNSCKNSWPASCLMDWMNQALDGERGYRLKCPMCSEEFCNMRQKYGTDFKTNQGKDDPESVLNAAWLRCVLFSPVFAREACLAQGKQLIFMKGSEAKHLVFLGKEKAIFHECEGLMNPTEMASKAAWLKRHYGDHLPFPIPQLQSMGISQTEATAIAQALSQGQSTQTLEAAADAVHAACENALTHLRAAKAEADSSRPVQIVELDPRFDSTWGHHRPWQQPIPNVALSDR